MCMDLYVVRNEKVELAISNTVQYRTRLHPGLMQDTFLHALWMVRKYNKEEQLKNCPSVLDVIIGLMRDKVISTSWQLMA